MNNGCVDSHSCGTNYIGAYDMYFITNPLLLLFLDTSMTMYGFHFSCFPKRIAQKALKERDLKEKETERMLLFKKIACFTGSAFFVQLIVMFALMWTL